MKRNLQTPVSLAEIAQVLGAELRGDPSVTVRRLASLRKADTESISFLVRPQQREAAHASHAVSIIVDELPTLYFHKIDRLIGTARSNKVAVTLGFQELPQLEADYGKNGMQKIITTCGNIFMGAARNKETLEWAQNDVFGKAKQTSKSITINDQKVSTSISERLDYLVPAAKIADMATGWLAGQSARDFTPTDGSMMQGFDIEKSEEFKTSKYFCKTHFDMAQIKQEERLYADLPKIYQFASDREKEIMLGRNFKRVNDEVDAMIAELLGKDRKKKQENKQ